MGEESPGQEPDRMLLLVRHAETLLNVEGRFRGRWDPALSLRGEHQAAALAEALGESLPTVIVSSPRRRALQTAHTIGKPHVIPVAIDRRLDDIDYGRWTGLTRSEAQRDWPVLFDDYLHDAHKVTFPSGEAILDAQQWAWGLVMELAQDGPPGPVALMTHDAIIRLTLCRALCAPLEALHNLTIDLASTSGITPREGSFSLRWVNDCSYRRYLFAPDAAEELA